jgi:hypothetical protein
MWSFKLGLFLTKKALSRLGLREIATLVLMDISINTIVKITTSNKNDYERLIHLRFCRVALFLVVSPLRFDVRS